MYTAYWKLQMRPFENALERRFYYPSETHQATLLKLRYAIENRRGAALLAGAAGLGKTLLVRTLAEDLPDSCGPLVHVKFPQVPPPQLLALIAHALTGESSAPASIDQSLLRIEQALVKNTEQERHTVVAIDEAHLLSETGGLETVRLLLNLEASWTVLLVGQPALLPALERMPALEERLGVKCLLRRFTLEETISYIQHRLRAAALIENQTLFALEALEAIHRLADGVPRRINRLCDLCLLIGYAEEFPQLTAAHVEAVAEEMLAPAAASRQAA